MSATGWLAFSITCFVLAGGFIALSVVLFLRFKIVGVVGDLSGKRAAKEVAALRADSARAKRNAGSSGHTSDFKAMAMAHENKRLDKTSGDLGGKAEVLDSEGGEPTEDFRTGGRAELLSDPNGAAITGVLNEKKEPAFGITQVLNENGDHYEIEMPEETRGTEDLKRIEHFEITRSETVIHTDEII